MAQKNGILLINLGTPDSLDKPAVRRYLREFLGDPRVINLPGVARWLLLNLVILPFRPKKSLEAYAQIWTDEGSPIKVHCESLTRRLQASIGSDTYVAYAMRYQQPSIDSVLDEFARRAIDRIAIVPLYPHYASSSFGSTLEKVYDLVARPWHVPSLSVVPPFYDHPAYIDSVAQAARDAFSEWDSLDHVLFSYHGLPEDHVKVGTQAATCLADDRCCDAVTDTNRYCYRAHCVATTHRVAKALGIKED